MSAKDTLGGATKADIQKVVAISFLGLFGAGIIYFFVVADVSEIKISGQLDVNQFWTVFVGIIIGIFTWLGFKQGQEKQQ